METVGQRIRTLRNKNGWTQDYLSKLIGKTAKTVSFYELDERNPSRAALVKMSAVFNVSIDYLLGRGDNIYENNKAPQSEGALRAYVYEKLGREPTPEELVRIDNFAETFIKGVDK